MVETQADTPEQLPLLAVVVVAGAVVVVLVVVGVVVGAVVVVGVVVVVVGAVVVVVETSLAHSQVIWMRPRLSSASWSNAPREKSRS